MKLMRNGGGLAIAGVTLAALAALPLWLNSCTPGEGITAAEADVVLTLYDGSADFSSFQTFAVVDSIVHLCGDDADCPNITRSLDSAIMAVVDSIMQARNYDPVPDPMTTLPDLTIALGAVQSDFYNLIGSGCGGWYYPWYPGGCWGYPPTMTPVYSYSTGTLVMLMANTKDPVQGNRLPILWNGDVSGVLGAQGGGSGDVLGGIRQAFNQSPYIQR